MFVQAVLLYRKGIGSFDPVSDGFLVFNREPEEARYYTWRKHGELIPQSATLAGVFLGDHYNKFTFEGTRNSGEHGYVHGIFPKLEAGYKHSEFHRLFEAPVTVEELIYKISLINELYFGAENEQASIPSYLSTAGFSWKLDTEKGITELRCPHDANGEFLSTEFYEIVREVSPGGYHCDPRIHLKARAEAIALALRIVE